MTTTFNPLPAPITRWRRKLAQNWRALFGPGDLFTLLILLVLLMMPVFSLVLGGWPLDTRTIIPITLMSLGFGFLLARSQYNELVALVFSGVYGLGLVALVTALNEPGNLGEGAVSLATRLAQWILDVFTGGINQDDLVFTLLMALLFWFLGYNVAWHTFRIDRIWRVILPPGLILVTNLIYNPGEANLDIFLLVFIFLSLLLIVRSYLDTRAWEWYVNGIRVPRTLRTQFLRVGAILALTAMLLAGLVQMRDLQERLDQFHQFLQSEPITQMSELWNRMFSSPMTQGPTTADYYGGDSLQLGGAIRLGEQMVFLVNAPQGRRYYWRSRVFDTYSNGRWAPSADIRLTTEQSPLQIQYQPDNLGARSPVQQRFTLGLSASRLIYAAPQPLQVDLSTRADLRYIPSNEAREGMNVSVIRPTRVLERGDEYTVTSLMTDATAAQLRNAGSSYPSWIPLIYMQVPGSVTERTRQLAQEIVTAAGASTPYDQAKAIETWLRLNIVYSEVIPQPPLDQDPVEWVLFDLRQGYCNYYATAMVMMLRTLGVPARMAAGFAQGTWDASQNSFTVLERDAHTWVEVYFPGYGWIEFEPTAAQSPLTRIDDAPAPNSLPSPTPLATATPTFTPTPPPSPTPDPSTPQPQEAPQLPTLTPTPTPTATPVIIPTQPPPMAQQPTGLLPTLLRALGAALLVLLIVVLLLGGGVFVYWWWEWRGMRGLNPIARAYARLERYLGLIGLRFGSEQTPDERRQRIVRQLPQAEPPVSAITGLYAAERYGRPSPPAEERGPKDEMADEAWVDARSSILRRYLRRFFPFLKG